MWHLLADVHFDIKTLPRLQSFFDFYLKRFEQTRPSHVVFLGDTFNVRTGTDAHLHRVFSDYLRRMLDAPQSPHIHLLVGNHDMKNRFDRTDNALYPFSLVRRQIQVYQEITRTSLDGHEVVFIPYHHDETQIARYIRTEPSDRLASTIAFYHGSFRGAIRNGALDSTHGVCHDSVIDSTNLGRYRRAFLGHFHTHGSPAACPNVTYVGSPIQSNMGDAGDLQHGFIEFNPKVDTWNLVLNPEAEYYVKMSWAESKVIPNRVYGKKVRLVLGVADQEEGLRTNEAIQRHVDHLYGLGAHHVELREPPPNGMAESSLETGKVLTASDESDEQLPYDDPLQEIGNLIPSFLGAEHRVMDSASVHDVTSLNTSRENYLRSILDDYSQQNGAITPAKIFDADLLQIEMCDFRGVSGKSVFDLDALSQGTIYLVTSDNGNGKSTLLEAVFWCLYGKFLDPDVNAEEAIHTGKRSCSVALYFRNGYIFTRSRTGKRPMFEIRYNGDVLEKGHDAGTTTQYLESHLLHMNSETFRRTFVITDHASSAFLATRDAQRTKSLDLMFGLEILRDVRSRLEEDLKQNRNQHLEIQAECDKASEILTALKSSWRNCSNEVDDLRRAINCKKTALQISTERNEEVKDQMRLKESSIQNSRRKREILENRNAQFRHLVTLYQKTETLEAKITQVRQQAGLHLLEKLRSSQEEVGRYRIALIKEENIKANPWARVRAFACRLRLQYINPFISAALYASSQISWLNRFFSPVIQRSLYRISSRTSPPVTIHSQDELRRLQSNLNKIEDLSQLLAKDTDRGFRNLHLKCKDEHDETLEPGLIADNASQETEEFLKFTEAKHMQVQSSLIANEKEYLSLAEENHELSCDIARQDGHLEQMIHQEKSCTQRADELIQQHQHLVQSLERSVEVRSKVEAMLALSTFWLEQLQDAPTQKGPFITYCRANHVSSLNMLIVQVLDELNQDSEGIATQRLHFQLKADYTLEPIQGALSIGKRSKGQKTRMYLALFLAMFQQARSRLSFRTSFVFLDEIMDTLDLHGIEALQRWLQRYVAARRMQAFLMTHRETTLVGNVIEVSRDRKRGTEYRLRQEEKPVDQL